MPNSMTTIPRLSPEREAEIGELAEFLANDRFPSTRIEPAEIAKSIGITVIPGRYNDEFDGMLEHDAGRFYIYCNLDRIESMASPRARFTLSHELGHYFIDEHRNALSSGLVPKHPSHCDHESKNLIEQEADHFASSLLMPHDRFHKRAKRIAPGLGAICQLANEFGTSITSTAVRYAKLDIVTCVIIKWDRDGYGWKWLSPAAYAIGWRKTIEEPAKLVAGSATEQIVAAIDRAKNEIKRTGSTAAHWLPFIALGSSRDCILIEEAIFLGRYGTLTMLFPECSVLG